MQVPSGWNFTSATIPVWSVKVWIKLFEFTSQRRTVLSSLPEAIIRASNENWAFLIQFVWPFRVWTNFLPLQTTSWLFYHQKQRANKNHRSWIKYFLQELNDLSKYKKTLLRCCSKVLLYYLLMQMPIMFLLGSQRHHRLSLCVPRIFEGGN